MVQSDYDNIVNMLEGYIDLSDTIVTRYQDKYEKFNVDYIPLRKKTLHAATVRDRKEAPAFNIFKILDADRAELKYSAFLASLLNPYGTHGQGFLFLRTFLDMFQRVHPNITVPNANIEEYTWQVRTEMGIKDGRLDIVIRSPDLGCLYVIENKVRAYEGEDQLIHYSDWLVKQPVDIYKNRALLFLTPSGRPAESAAPNLYFPLSYREDISGWLMVCLDEEHGIKANAVNEVVIQFLSVIASHNMKKVMMNVEKEINDYLLNPDNLETALDVSARIEKLKKELHREFWDKLSNELKARLRKSDAKSSWYLHMSDKKKWLDPWCKCAIQPKSPTRDKEIPSLNALFRQHKNGLQFYFGIRFLPDEPAGVVLPEIDDLREKLSEIGLYHDKNWPGMEYTEYYAQTGPFVLKMYNERESFIQEMADLIWNPFIGARPQIEAVNRNLSAIYSRE